MTQLENELAAHATTWVAAMMANVRLGSGVRVTVSPRSGGWFEHQAAATDPPDVWLDPEDDREYLMIKLMSIDGSAESGYVNVPTSAPVLMERIGGVWRFRYTDVGADILLSVVARA